MFVQDEPSLPAEVDDVLRLCEVLLGQPKLFNTDALDLQMVGYLGKDGVIDLQRHFDSAVIVNAILILLIQHFLFYNI